MKAWFHDILQDFGEKSAKQMDSSFLRRELPCDTDCKSDYIYPLMKHFYPDGSSLFQDEHRVSPLSTGYDGSLNCRLIFHPQLKYKQVTKVNQAYKRSLWKVLSVSHIACIQFSFSWANWTSHQNMK